MGGGSSSSSSSYRKPVTMPGAQFQPFSYKSLGGAAKAERDGEYGMTFSQELDPRLQELYGQGLGATSGLLSQYLEQAQAPLEQFDFQKGIDEATQEYFTQQQAALDPVFAQQRQQLQSDLFGSGRMGLMLAGETAGAGAGGMVQPDAFGLSRGQSQALQEAYAKSRAAAVGEQQQAFDQAKQQYALNQAAQQQQLANLLGGYQGAFGTAGQVLGIEQGLIGQAAGLEAARANAYANSIFYEERSKSSSSDGGLGGSFGGSLLSSAGDVVGKVIGEKGTDLAVDAIKTYLMTNSDIKLKKNIKKVGTKNGFNVYTWDWNKIAQDLGILNQPTRGVIAQEVLEIAPDAVGKHPINGYLTVNYDMIGVAR